MTNFIFFLIIIFLFNSCCPKIQQKDLFFYKQKDRNTIHNKLQYNKIYIGKTSNNYYYHLIFFKEGIFEFSILNESKDMILNNKFYKRCGLFKIEEDNIYLEAYGSCNLGFFFQKLILLNNDSLKYLGYTHRVSFQWTFGLEPSYKNLYGEPMIYELYRDSNNQTLNFDLDTNKLKFGD